MACTTAPHARADGTVGTFFDVTQKEWTIADSRVDQQGVRAPAGADDDWCAWYPYYERVP